MRVLLAVMLLGASAHGCASTATAYRFRAPLVSSVRAAELPPASAAAGAAPSPESARYADLPAPHRPRPQPQAAPGTSTSEAPASGRASQPGDRAGDSASPAEVAGSRSMAEILRSLVGQREPAASHVEFAVAALEAVGVRLAAEARSATTGAELVAVAEARDALARKNPLPGDLVVFDRVDNDQEASLIGVIVAARASGKHTTVEFVYLGRGVARRGYVTPGAPATKRDAEGRALNTFVRGLNGKAPKDATFLAGELFRTYVRIDRLSGS